MKRLLTVICLAVWLGCAQDLAAQGLVITNARILDGSGRVIEPGTLEAGKIADIVILDGDPLGNASKLLNVAMVIKGGDVVLDKRR